MTYAQRILDYLWSVAPGGATNGQIARALGISSQQTVYLLTQDLLGQRLVRGVQQGRTWVFYGQEEVASASASGWLTPGPFVESARRLLGERYGTEPSPGLVPGLAKQFDFVSPGGQIVGHALYHWSTGGFAPPSPQFSAIAEHVWLLEKTGASTTFLVFGNDREVPVRWLQRYGSLVSSVAFYFLSDDGNLGLLLPP